MEFKAPRGTKDILPAEIEVWDRLVDTAKSVFGRYGYKRIETPVFESTGLFTRAIGETTDIVKKEMYTFKDRKGRELTLRPEETAPVVRAFIEHKMHVEGSLFKVFYWGPMFRYERPQAGRQRQFWQIGIEAIGSPDAALDAEVIQMAAVYLHEIGLTGVKIHLNSVGDKCCRPKYTDALKVFLKQESEGFCEDCRIRADTNPMRVFDCKNRACGAKLREAPVIMRYLCDECKRHYADVTGYLDDLGIDHVHDDHLVRGLDYYTRTTFEIKHAGLGAQDAVCAGGRYDDLVKQYGGPESPAIGFAIGMERAILAVRTGNDREEEKSLDGYIIALGDDAKRKGMLLASSLRAKGIKTAYDFSGKSLKGQMKNADKAGSRFAVIIGENELKDGSVTIRDMETGEQRSVPVKEADTWLTKDSGI